jgi:hypothetical protein
MNPFLTCECHQNGHRARSRTRAATQKVITLVTMGKPGNMKGLKRRSLECVLYIIDFIYIFCLIHENTRQPWRPRKRTPTWGRHLMGRRRSTATITSLLSLPLPCYVEWPPFSRAFRCSPSRAVMPSPSLRCRRRKEATSAALAPSATPATSTSCPRSASLGPPSRTTCTSFTQWRRPIWRPLCVSDPPR